MIKKFLSLFKAKWVKMKIDKVFIDPLSGKLHIMLKSDNDKSLKYFLNSIIVNNEGIFRSLFFSSFLSKKIFKELKIKLKKVKIVKKMNSDDSAICIFITDGIFRKKVFLSTVEALKLATESNADIYVNRKILSEGNYYTEQGEKVNSNINMENNAFFAKFNERNVNYKNEVIM